MGATRDQAPARTPEKKADGEQKQGGGAAPQARSAWQSYVKAVQAKGAMQQLGAAAQATAAAGVQGSGGALPHGDRIQAAFGKHDVGGVKAHVGGAAARASDELGAEAYAVGDAVAFGKSPDLHTAAHEAAHVVQQRGGVQLKGGVGQSGDAYEKHADAVADKVVAGQSAEGLLDQMAGGRSAGAAAGKAVQKKEKMPAGQEEFDKMWEAHPHNYQDDESQNTDSEDLLADHGLPSGYNTCAIRMSIMLNKLGFRITPAKTAAAGLKRKPTYSRKTKEYYILAASEMWQYMAKNFRKADKIFPADKSYKDAAAFDAAYETDIKPVVSSRKGIVAFEKIYGYGGTGHVDLFDGEKLSDADGWYPCQKLHLWYIVVP